MAMEMERQRMRVDIEDQIPCNDYLHIIQMHLENDVLFKICATEETIPKAIRIAEVSQERGLATKRRVFTSTDSSRDNFHWAKIEILMKKTNGGNRMNVPVPVPAPVYNFYAPPVPGYNFHAPPVLGYNFYAPPVPGYNFYAPPVPGYNFYCPLVPVPVYHQMDVPIPPPYYNVYNDKYFMDSLNEAKTFLNNHTEIHLCALERAIPKAIRIAQILVRRRFAVKTEVLTFNATSTDNPADRSLDMAKIKIRLRRIAR